MGASVIIAAAGSAQRMNGTDKVLYRICKKEVLCFSLLAFAKAKCIDEIIVVTASDKIEINKKIAQNLKLAVPVLVTEGGRTRQESVFNGLKLCNKDSECVMIHDAARPMITAEKIDFLYHKIINENLKAAALGVPVKDTVKMIDGKGKITQTPPRQSLFIAQTPQGFSMELYRAAVEKAQRENCCYTDDCQLVEAMGVPVYMVEGDYKNIKITTPEDLITAETFLKERAE